MVKEVSTTNKWRKWTVTSQGIVYGNQSLKNGIRLREDLEWKDDGKKKAILPAILVLAILASTPWWFDAFITFCAKVMIRLQIPEVVSLLQNIVGMFR